jgi:aryl-alcohol dehydrogenase-like predicted oxidoreductase
VKTRVFGKTSLTVSEFGLGCARIGGIFQQDTSGFLRLLSEAYESGINFFDTADMYSQGESEVLVGRALRSVRGRVVIASKAGYCLPGRRKLAARIKPVLRPVIQLLKIRRDRLPAGARGALAQDFSPAYLTRAVEASLRRLGTDYLDLLQLHSPPEEIVARGEWEPALERLKRAGKIRFYGISCDTVEASLAALRFPGVSSLQVVVNLLERRKLEQVVPEARAKGVPIIARECLANGLLLKRPAEIDLSKYCRPDEFPLREQQLAAFHEEAATTGRSQVDLALDFVTAVEGVHVTLLGVRTVEQLRGLLERPGRPGAGGVTAPAA